MTQQALRHNFLSLCINNTYHFVTRCAFCDRQVWTVYGPWTPLCRYVYDKVVLDLLVNNSVFPWIVAYVEYKLNFLFNTDSKNIFSSQIFCTATNKVLAIVIVLHLDNFGSCLTFVFPPHFKTHLSLLKSGFLLSRPRTVCCFDLTLTRQKWLRVQELWSGENSRSWIWPQSDIFESVDLPIIP